MGRRNSDACFRRGCAYAGSREPLTTLCFTRSLLFAGPSHFRRRRRLPVGMRACYASMTRRCYVICHPDEGVGASAMVWGGDTGAGSIRAVRCVVLQVIVLAPFLAIVSPPSTKTLCIVESSLSSSSTLRKTVLEFLNHVLKNEV